jgi:hypothetical protein
MGDEWRFRRNLEGLIEIMSGIFLEELLKRTKGFNQDNQYFDQDSKPSTFKVQIKMLSLFLLLQNVNMLQIGTY